MTARGGSAAPNCRTSTANRTLRVIKTHGASEPNDFPSKLKSDKTLDPAPGASMSGHHENPPQGRKGNMDHCCECWVYGNHLHQPKSRCCSACCSTQRQQKPHHPLPLSSYCYQRLQDCTPLFRAMCFVQASAPLHEPPCPISPRTLTAAKMPMSPWTTRPQDGRLRPTKPRERVVKA